MTTSMIQIWPIIQADNHHLTVLIMRTHFPLKEWAVEHQMSQHEHENISRKQLDLCISSADVSHYMPTSNYLMTFLFLSSFMSSSYLFRCSVFFVFISEIKFDTEEGIYFFDYASLFWTFLTDDLLCFFTLSWISWLHPTIFSQANDSVDSTLQSLTRSLNQLTPPCNSQPGQWISWLHPTILNQANESVDSTLHSSTSQLHFFKSIIKVWCNICTLK